MDWSHGGVPWRGPNGVSRTWTIALSTRPPLARKASSSCLMRPPPTVAPVRSRITREGSLPRRFSSQGGSNPSRTVCHGHRGAPPADATRGALDAADDARRRRERARLREGWLGRVPSQRGGIRIDRGRPAGNSEPSAERQGRVKEKPRGRDRERRMGDGGSIATEQADS